jgi:lipoate synthase
VFRAHIWDTTPNDKRKRVDISSMVMKYCPNCKQNVDTKRTAGQWVVGGLLALACKRRCPMCNIKETEMEEPRPRDQINDLI